LIRRATESAREPVMATEKMQSSDSGLIDRETPRVALVHEAQILEDLSYFMGEKDRRISIIVTPKEVYRIL